MTRFAWWLVRATPAPSRLRYVSYTDFVTRGPMRGVEITLGRWKLTTWFGKNAHLAAAACTIGDVGREWRSVPWNPNWSPA